MNFRGINDFRDRRNQFINMPYNQMHYSLASYCIESSKDDMKATFGDEFLSNLPIIPDPLRKNLADTLITAEVPKKVKTKSFLEEETLRTSMEPTKVELNTDRPESHTFSSITNFISGVFNVLSSAMFRSKPEDQHYGFDYSNKRQRSPETWQSPKVADQNIYERAHEQNGEKDNKKPMEIHNDSHTTVTTCEAKLNQVRNLLNTKSVHNIRRYRPRRPTKQFVDVGAYEEEYEDAFTTEDCISNLANESLVKYTCPTSYQHSDFLEIDGPITKTHMAPQDIETVPQANEISTECDKTKLDSNNCNTEAISEKNSNIISSCEDKLSKLKALIQQRNKPPSTDLVPDTESVMPVSEVKHIQKNTPAPKIHDKHYKNHHRTTNKRQKTNMHRAIQEEMLFANEIDPDGWSSVENSPPVLTENKPLSETLTNQTDYFDEVKGRFRNASTTDSDDSFQIVFAEPQRTRKVSECDSEDSFIVFDDSPDNCYLSTDVFDNQSDIESDYSDTDSEVSDSGCGTNLRCQKLSPYLSRTISDLTDDALYEEPSKEGDEVDCAFRTAEELPNQAIKEVAVVEKKKCKKVHFSPLPPKVHVMRVWAFAARQARAGHWERHTLDRERFKRRIADVEMAVSWVLKPQHRSRVMFHRFMPWWNAQRRKELAEKQETERQRQQAQIEEDRNRIEEQKKTEDEQVREEKDLESNDDNVNLTNHSENDKASINKEINVNFNVDDQKCKDFDINMVNNDFNPTAVVNNVNKVN